MCRAGPGALGESAATILVVGRAVAGIGACALALTGGVSANLAASDLATSGFQFVLQRLLKTSAGQAVFGAGLAIDHYHAAFGGMTGYWQDRQRQSAICASAGEKACRCGQCKKIDPSPCHASLLFEVAPS